MFGHAGEGVDDGKQDNKLAPSTGISHAADEATEDHRGTESSNKEDGDKMLRVSVLVIEGVAVGKGVQAEGDIEDTVRYCKKLMPFTCGPSTTESAKILASRQKENSHIWSLEPVAEGRQHIHSQISPKEGGMASLLGCLAHPIACVGCGGTLLEEGLVFVLVVRVLLIPRRRTAVQLELVRAAERDGHVNGKRYAEDQRIVGHCCTRAHGYPSRS